MVTLHDSATYVARLDWLSVLEITGDDRHVWLQGQISNDVHGLVNGGTLHGFHLDAQGKILAELTGVHVDSRWLLVVDALVGKELVTLLDRRIVMEDVTLRLRDDLHIISISDALTTAESGFDCVASITSGRSGRSSRELIVTSSTADTVVRVALDRGAELLDSAGFDAVRTRMGRPRFGVDFGPWTMPHETGLLRSAVSFNKGCYVGQEPVVMVEHRGKPPRRMCVVHSSEDPRAVPFDLSRTDGTVVGRATSFVARESGDARAVGIALVKRAAAEVGAELMSDGLTIRIEALVGGVPA